MQVFSSLRYVDARPAVPETKSLAFTTSFTLERSALKMGKGLNSEVSLAISSLTGVVQSAV